MKKTMLIFLMLGLGFIGNTSFANKIKTDKNTDNTTDCLLIRDNKNIKQQLLKCSDDEIFINYYQQHLYFVKQLEFKHPYLRKDILKYHNLFNLGLLELKKNGKMSIKMIKKIKKRRDNLYLKIQQYE